MSDQQKYTSKLFGKRVLIVGGSSGIGYCVAEACLEHGCEVIISSSNQSRIDEAIGRLQKTYPSRKDKLSGLSCSLNDETTLEENVKALLASATFDGSKKLDHIVYTAGDKLAVMPLADTSVEMIKQAGMVRVLAPLMLGKHASHYLTPGPSSSIILSGAVISERPQPNWGVVTTWANALLGVNKALALECAPVRFNLVSPGRIQTELWDWIPEEKKQETFKELGEVLPTGRFGRPEDIAEAYLYCMRDHNVTGNVIESNGGVLLKGP